MPLSLPTRLLPLSDTMARGTPYRYDVLVEYVQDLGGGRVFVYAGTASTHRDRESANTTSLRTLLPP
jgi:hypothetical protein